MTQPINKQEFLDFILPLLKEVGDYQKSRWNKALKIDFKSVANPVTEVDKNSEDMIVAAIQKRFPGHDILAEEGSGQRTASPFKWIIDPLDGTINFSHGYPLFCVSVALEFEGSILAGAVYDPLRDELFHAHQGQGAYLNSERICVSSVLRLDHALVVTGFAYNVRTSKNNNIIHFNNMLYKAQAVRRDGVAAIDLCYVACGRYDAFWELNLYPWDTAAGVIISKEAGACVSCFNGSPYSVYEKELLVTNTHLQKEMISNLTLDAGLTNS